MSLLQLKVNPVLKKAIEAKANEYGVPASSLARIALVNAFVKYDWCPPSARDVPESPIQAMTLNQYIKKSGGKQKISNEEFETTMGRISRAISIKFRNGRLPPIEEQLKNL